MIVSTKIRKMNHRRWQSLGLLCSFTILFVICNGQDNLEQTENRGNIFDEVKDTNGEVDDVSYCEDVLIIGTDMIESISRVDGTNAIEDIQTPTYTIVKGLLEDGLNITIKLPHQPLRCLQNVHDLQMYTYIEPEPEPEEYFGLEDFLQVIIPNSGHIVLVADTSSPLTRDTDVLIHYMTENGALPIDVIMVDPTNDNKGSRYRRQSNPYQTIATLSGGSVIHTTKTGISSVVDLLKLTLKQSTVTVMLFTFEVSMGKSFKVPVDDTMTELTIQVQSLNGTAPVVMANQPSGGSVSLSKSSGNSIRVLGGTIALMELKIQTGDYGQFTIQGFGTALWEVKITAQSPVDFTYNFMEPGANGAGQFPISGQPMAGAIHKIVIKVPEYTKVKDVVKVLFVEAHNNILNSIPLTNVGGRHGKDLWEASNVPIPKDTFNVAIEGTDKHGNVYRRLQPIPVSPVSVKLEVPSMAGAKLYKGETLQIPFVVTNMGGTQQDVDVSIEDDKTFTQAPIRISYTLSSHQNDSNTFTIKAGMVVGVTVTVSISAKPYLRGHVTNAQFEVRRFTVEERKKKPEDKIDPTCNVTSVSGLCDFGSDLCACAEHRWSMDVEVGDVGFGLQDVVLVSAGSNSSFHVDNFTIGHNISMGVITARVEADCCHQSAIISVSDKAGNQAQCSPNITQNFQPPDPKLCNKTIPLNVTIPCQSTNKTGKCDFGTDKCDCHTKGWHLKVEFGTVGLDLFQAFTTGAGNNASLTHTNQFVELDLDCCHQQITINGLDMGGNVGQCNVSLSNFVTPTPGDCTTTTLTTPTTTTTTMNTTTTATPTTATSGSTPNNNSSTPSGSTTTHQPGAATSKPTGTPNTAGGPSAKSTKSPSGVAPSGVTGGNGGTTSGGTGGASGGTGGAGGSVSGKSTVSGIVTAASINSETNSDNGSNGIPTAAVAVGMTVGAVAGLTAVLVMAFLFRRALTKVGKGDLDANPYRRGSSPVAWS